MKFETKVGSRTGTLSVDANRFRYEREDGAAAGGEFSLQPLEPGVVSVVVDGRTFRVVNTGSEISVNGRSINVEVLDPRSMRGHKAAGGAQGRHKIAALMPGKVVRVLVSVGDEVQEGQGLVVVEAMKMQNEMKSLQNGRVVEVRTKADATVSAGDVLIVVE